jgi:hypothetical protein
MNLSNLVNPRKQAVRKWLIEMLREKYTKHDNLVERMSHYLVTEKDMDEFTRFVADLFEMGYLKCLNDYKAKLKELGLNVKVVGKPYEEENLGC